MSRYLLAIDQGTTGSTVVVLGEDGAIRAKANREFPQHYPPGKSGWVEHDPDEIWQSVLDALGDALAQAGVDGASCAGIGITNQRETTILWERASGRPIHRAIVWQDRRTAPRCAALEAAGHGPLFRARTGLVLDAYFSGTKIEWILDHVDGSRARAEELAFGTVDSFLVNRLSGGAAHVTDATNASRTLLYDIHRGRWDDELLDLLRVPRAVLPEVRSSSEIYATTRGVPGLADGTPIAGIAGDQQAALFGQTCFAPGEAKCTYGTGAFVLVNTGETPLESRHGLLTTIAWQLGGRTVYALEGSAFIAGAAVQWLRDGLGLIERSADVEALARTVDDAGGVVFVPALVGLGAPHWDPDARGLIMGLGRETTRAHVARATLEGIAFSVADLVRAMEADGARLARLRVDGGASENDLLMQFQSDLLGVESDRPASVETTALGAAYLAGLAVGVFPDLDAIVGAHRIAKTFRPSMDEGTREAHLARWRRAVDRARTVTA
ncbi:MAG: glycerol kinase GlpK [Sandaracinaceae bacterium]|nr:glycerol kinase GlpK [Sandaracinaceae bacterium]